MKAKHIFLLLLLSGSWLLTTGLNAQNSSQSVGQNALYAELFGPGMSLSFNYDFRFQKANSGLGMRFGIGGMKIRDVDILAIPVGLNYLLGNNNRFFELGLAAVYIKDGFYIVRDEGSGSDIVGVFTMAFRHQPQGQGVNFRVGLNPVIGTDDKDEFYFFPFYGGLSVGYTF